MGRGPVGADVVLTLARAAAACAVPRPRSGPDPVGAALEAAVDASPFGHERRDLLGDLAERRPDLILRRAVDWLSDDDAEVLVRLPEHYLRVAVAGALRPWSRRAIEEVVRALREGSAHAAPGEVRPPVGAPSLGFDPAEIVGRVMADEYPELTRPAGFPEDPGRRWHVVGSELWGWSLWRSDDGRHALTAVVSSGLGEYEVSELVEESLVDAWLRDGPAALDERLARLRAGRRTPARPR